MIKKDQIFELKLEDYSCPRYMSAIKPYYGTMDEMMDVVASGTVDEHRKPCFVLNYQGFYEGLKLQAEHMRKLTFLPQEEQYAPQFVDTIEELIDKLKGIKLKK